MLSRAEPRDLVDLYFRDDAGYPPEADLALALTKGAGSDPGILAHLLESFPVSPLALMLSTMSTDELARFRAELAQRFRTTALPAE